VKNYSILAASVLALSVSSPAFADSNTNMSHVDQIGTAITANVTQGGTGNTSTSDIEQGLVVPGNNLDATVMQGGLSGTNDAAVIQDGTNQDSFLDQHGDTTSNVASISQDGNANQATINQNGTNNFNDSTTVQHGLGALNTVIVDQGGMGNTNDSTVTQSGGGLVANVTQN
jgi:hypothetical protein